ncbi:hypothetical protein [Pseudomonas sp. NPDC089569]|uniref:hypothetical protein n=1 Tax=Pseudomonas sp. NPDC089569 TaxID=3390722 RepID=UPI003CFDEE14
MLAMVVNDGAYSLVERGAFEFLASMLAPTGITALYVRLENQRPVLQQVISRATYLLRPDGKLRARKRGDPSASP